MQIAALISGYSLGEADILRRAMGKKEPAVMAAQRQRFCDGAVQQGFPADKAETLFNLIEKFAGYGFNKSHSAAYALISYQTAYVKAHYPLEFLAALFTSEINNTTTLTKHIQEARDQGVILLPPDLNRSERDFVVENGQIRFGLAGVKNVGENAIRAILEARKKGPFTSFQNFLARVSQKRVNKKVLEALIQSGAVDSLQPNRARLFQGLESILERVQAYQKIRATKQMDMFGGLTDDAAESEDWLPMVPDWDEAEKLSREKAALGVYLSGHPLAKYRRELQALADLSINGLEEWAGNGSVALGGLVTALKETVTKKGDRMAFVTLEDLEGSVEVVVFSDLYARVESLLKEPALPLLVRGSVSQEEKGPKLIAQEISSLAAAGAHLPPRLDFRLHAASLEREDLLRLRDLLTRYPGPIPAFLHLVINNSPEEILALPEAFHLKPCRSLADEVNRLFGYTVLDF